MFYCLIIFINYSLFWCKIRKIYEKLGYDTLFNEKKRLNFADEKINAFISHDAEQRRPC